jgi:diaminopimelate epimerase
LCKRDRERESIEPMKFSRYHALGNDYIVMRRRELTCRLTSAEAQRICHRNLGVGSDGILVHEEDRDGIFYLRIFNPDGSEAEKSGNGLRIFARYLWDNKFISAEPFKIYTAGGVVTAQVAADGRQVTVEMGRVRFSSGAIPVVGPEREVVNEAIVVDGREFLYSAATIGNPHCVVTNAEVTAQEACRIGPLLENHPNFPKRTNVQLLKVIDRSTIQLEIWERGAGYTLASGSSSSAAASVAHRLGLVDSDITVCMPGGSLSISLTDSYDVTMTGPVTRIAVGELYAEAL